MDRSDMKELDGNISELIEIIKRLRAPDGCPWDREQTPVSVKKYIVEEAYELIDAIDDNDPREVAEELGDLIFMLLFVARIYEENGALNLEDVIKGAARKMIRRHPHIFGDVQVKDSKDVIANWQAIKAEEARDKGTRHSALGNLPRALPALQRAFRLGERASRVGFDWKEADDVLEKLHEEEGELRAAIRSGDEKELRQETGDLLFTVANLARKLGVNPEEVLQEANSRFSKRFHAMETLLRDQGKDLNECSLEEMDKAWEQVKDTL